MDLVLCHLRMTIYLHKKIYHLVNAVIYQIIRMAKTHCYQIKNKFGILKNDQIVLFDHNRINCNKANAAGFSAKFIDNDTREISGLTYSDFVPFLFKGIAHIASTNVIQSVGDQFDEMDNKNHPLGIISLETIDGFDRKSTFNHVGTIWMYKWMQTNTKSH